MTAEQLEELLGKVTQGEWVITGQPDKVCAEGYTKQGAAKVIVEVKEKSWMPASEQFANADLIALAPSIARRVLAAEKLVEALARLGTPSCFGSGEVLGMYLPESPMGREIIARMGFAKDAIIAYREASK